MKTLSVRVVQESRREKEVPTEIPLSSKPSAKSEPAPPGEQPASTASAASKVSSFEPEMPLEGEEDGKAAGRPLSTPGPPAETPAPARPPPSRAS